MTAERQIKVLNDLKERIEDCRDYPYMCVYLLYNFTLTHEQVDEVLDLLWESRVEEKLNKDTIVESKGRPVVWYRITRTLADKEVRIQNIDNAIKKLQESLEITK